MKRSVEILVLILFYLTLEISAQKTYYVSTQGSDTSSGDLNHPFRNIQEAINQSEGGDRREVKTLVKEVLEPGNYTCDFNAESYASGIYFCRITAGSYSDVIKMQLLK